MKFRDSYGDPPYLIPTLFMKSLVVTGLLAVIGVAIISLIDMPPSRVDFVGGAICTPILAYLIHLWLAPIQ